MKVFLLVLLAALMCSTQVHTLQCYICDGEEGCTSSTDCAPNETFCKKSWTDSSVTRSCEAVCNREEFVDCCQDDECNF